MERNEFVDILNLDVASRFTDPDTDSLSFIK